MYSEDTAHSISCKENQEKIFFSIVSSIHSCNWIHKQNQIPLLTKHDHFMVFLSTWFLKSDSKRKAQNYIQNFVSKKFREQFYFLTYILPDNVFHESIKEFWQNSHFENMRAGFLKVVKTHFGKLALKWCIFRHDKNIF